MAALSLSMASWALLVHSKVTLARVRLVRGQEMNVKSLIQVRMVPMVPRKPRTSIFVEQGGQFEIFETLDESGTRPS